MKLLNENSLKMGASVGGINAYDATLLPEINAATTQRVKRCYGSSKDFLSTFATISSKNSLCTIKSFIEDAVRSSTPTLAQCMSVYPTEIITALVRSHLVVTLEKIGKISNYSTLQIEDTVIAMLSNQTARTLTLYSFLGFFIDLCSGRYKFYHGDRAELMNFFFEYCIEAVDKEGDVRADAQKQKERQLQEQHDNASLSWEQYKLSHEIDVDVSLQEYLLNQV